MTDFPFLTASVRGMAARLFPAASIRELAEASSFEAVIASLERERQESFSALGHQRSALDAFEDAIRKNTREELQRLLRRAKSEGVSDPLRLLMVRWQLDDVKTLLRARERSSGAPTASESAAPLLHGVAGPVEATARVLESASPEAFREALVALPWHPVVRHSLFRLAPGEAAEKLERQLDHHALSAALKHVDEPELEPIQYALRCDVDIRNIRLALHSAGSEEAAAARGFALEHGHLGPEILHRLFAAENRDDVIEVLNGTRYGEAVSRGLIAYASLGTVVVIERLFDDAILGLLAHKARIEPLSLWPVVRYVYRLINEQRNLLLLLRLKFHRMPAGTIKELLIYA